MHNAYIHVYIHTNMRTYIEKRGSVGLKRGLGLSNCTIFGFLRAKGGCFSTFQVLAHSAVVRV